MSEVDVVDYAPKRRTVVLNDEGRGRCEGDVVVMGKIHTTHRRTADHLVFVIDARGSALRRQKTKPNMLRGKPKTAIANYRIWANPKPGEHATGLYS